VKDTEWLIKNTAEGVPLDTALIGAARSVEHYEMALYMAAQEWAEKLENTQIATLMKESGAEEANAGMKLGNLGAQVLERIKVN
jgi:ferritin-like metal-binding protein YciE